MKNYYEILNVPFDADLKLIKKSYRQLALKYHPDKNKSSDSHERFVVIVEAYEVLSNELARKEYDLLYTQYYINKQELSQERVTNYKERKTQGSKKGEEYARKKYKEFNEILDELTFHTSNYVKIGCVGGIFIFLGVVWIIGPVFILMTANSDEVILPAFISFVMGIGALIIRNKKIRELKENYEIKKSNNKSN